MAFQSTPQGIEVVVAGQQDGIPVVNVYHVDANAAVTQEVLDEVAGIFANWMVDTVIGSLSSSYTCNTITATDISTEGGAQAVVTLLADNVGGATGAPTAANAAMVISWRTDRTGRSYRGRTYIGALPASQMNDEHNVEVTYAGAFAGYADALLDLLTAAGYTLSVLSRILAGVVRAVGVLTEITGIIVDTKIDSQRRRTAN